LWALDELSLSAVSGTFSLAAGLAFVYRPVIPVRVIGPLGAKDLIALVDTGSDDTLLPRSVGDAVGAMIDDNQKSNVTGFGAQRVPVAPGDVELELSDGQDAYRWPATVSFVSFADPNDEIAVLGHAGFLEFFTATFDGGARTLELVANARFPGRLSP
jgi:hypothetical protein